MHSGYKTIFIRRADEADAQDILSITREAFEKYAYDLGKPEMVFALKDDIDGVLKDIAEKNVYIAMLDDEPVGTIRFHVKAGTGFISRFGVRLKAQSCGVGRALIQAVFHDCHRMQLPAVTLHTSSRMSSLIRFYYGQGFYIRSTNTDRGYVRALLVKELEPDYEVDAEALKP